MKIKTYFIAVAIASIALMSGCEKGDTGPAGTPGANATPVTGNIVGFITLYDDNSNLIENASGASITLEGAPTLNATSDSTGRFEIINVPSGTYNIDFTKQGFAETKTIGYQVVGGATPLLTTKILCQQTSSYVQLTGVSIDTNTYNWVNLSLQTGYSDTISKSSYVAVHIFYSLNSTVSDSVYDGILTVASQIPAKNNPYTNAYDFSLSYYPSGTKVYFIAYAGPDFSSTYVNPATGKTVYPGLNPNASQVMSVVLP